MTVEIIAEIGINHQCNFEIGRDLIIAAKEAGATAVKFQASVPELETSGREAPEHLAMIKSLVPTRDMLLSWLAVAREAQIEWLCTPAEESSLVWLVDVARVKRIKVASDNLTNLPFLEAVARTELPVILSTGMGTFAEIQEAVDILDCGGDLTLLHCTSAYPCPIVDANLLMIHELMDDFGYRVGWSDHTTNLLLPAVAAGMGAVMIEKHITFDKSARGPDHAASITSDEFAQMVRNIREAEAAMMATDIRRPWPCERASFRTSRKSLVAARPIGEGQIITEDMIAIKRPGTGVPASALDEMLGEVADRDYEVDQFLRFPGQ